MADATQLAEALRLCLPAFKGRATARLNDWRIADSTARESEAELKQAKEWEELLAAFEAQAATAAEPVARVAEWQSDVTATIECLPHTGALMKAGDLLYAAPVSQAEPRKPLTDEQKENLVTAHFPEQRKRVLALIAAVEKFYGIKENP